MNRNEKWSTANRLVEQNRFREALALYKQLPKSSKIYYNVAIIYLKRQKYQKAITMLHKSLELDSYNCMSHFVLGCCFFKLNLTVQGMSQYSKCMAMMNNNDYINYKPLGLNMHLKKTDVQSGHIRGEFKLYYPLNRGTMLTPPASPQSNVNKSTVNISYI